MFAATARRKDVKSYTRTPPSLACMGVATWLLYHTLQSVSRSADQNTADRFLLPKIVRSFGEPSAINVPGVPGASAPAAGAAGGAGVSPAK